MHLVLLTLLAGLCLASPLTKRNTISTNDLIKAYPSTASCAGAAVPDECRTADQAAPNIASSFTTFGITDFNSQAALVALMLYESSGFKYSINHYPGVPGQGTRNMQSPAYNRQYAMWLAYITDSGINGKTVGAAIAEGPVAVLGLVNCDRWSFGSAAWYLKTQCSQSVKQALASGTQAGWTSYLQCVGAPASDDRLKIYNAVKALGNWSS